MWRPAYLVYLAYYIKNTNYRKLRASMRWVHENRDKGYAALAGDILACSVKFATSFEDYFKYHFVDFGDAERSMYAGAGIMHRFTTQMNDRRYRQIFRSKALFYRHFSQYMGRSSIYLRENSPETFAGWISTRPVVVVKPNLGARGNGVEFIDTTKREPQELYWSLLHNGQDVMEEAIIQHDALQRLYPSSVNTVRVVTVRTGSQVDIIGTDLKFGINGNHVDNLHAGGISAPIDPETGIVTRGAISNSVWSPRYERHPDTQEAILGFQVPFWTSVMELARQVSDLVPQVRTVGWDIAVTVTGAILVEGNDNWGGPIWQFSSGKGRIDVLRRYANV
ncbi:MAG: sugar-transfer associated ATP-grasp domain-containing protein [Anaerolineae bacterium]